MGFQGDLRSIDLADLLQSMASRQQSGLLEIMTRDGSWTLSLRDGAIVGLSSQPSHDFWSRLVQNGMLTAEQFKEARGAARKQALAKVLIDGGFIKAERLRALFIEFVYDELCEVVTLRRGRVEMRENEFLDDKNWAVLDLRLPVTKVILESARRHDHWEFVHRYIAGPGAVLTSASRAQQALEAGKGNEIAAAILARVRPDRSIGEIADSLPFSRSEVFREAAELVKHGLLRCANPDDSSVTQSQLCAVCATSAEANEPPFDGTAPAEANEPPFDGAAPAEAHESPFDGTVLSPPTAGVPEAVLSQAGDDDAAAAKAAPRRAFSMPARHIRLACVIAASAFVAALIVFSSYEAYACSKFIALTRKCIHDGVSDPARIEAAIAECERFRAAHPAAFVATFHAQELLNELAGRQAALDAAPAHGDEDPTGGENGFRGP